MPDQISPREFHDAPGSDDWRVVAEGAVAFFRTESLAASAALVTAIAVFFIAWAVIAARPWVAETAAGGDPRTATLDAREARLRDEAARVQRLLDRRWAAYRRDLRERRAQNAATVRRNEQLASMPPQVITLPSSQAPVTSTRSS